MASGVKPEAVKTSSSLRSVRVKPERIREKEIKQEKDSSDTPDQVVYNVRVTSTVSSMANSENRIPTLVEGKENVPMLRRSISNEDKKSENSNEDVEGSRNILNNVKKRKLDILKEGGLEVTPIPIDTAVILKDQVSSKPSSIINHVSITVTSDGKGSSSRNSGASASNSSPGKNGIQSQSQFYNHSPPKVVQSRSIYSYSEKTVYGNPKDPFMPPPPPVFQPPRHYVKIPTRPSCPVDILDLSAGTATAGGKPTHKPIVEIVKIPSVPSKESVQFTKYPVASLLDNKRLGSNLEITLVGSPSPKGASPNHQDGHFPFNKRSPGGKAAKSNATNGKPYQGAPNLPPNFRYEGSSKQKQTTSPKANSNKPFAYGSSQMLPDYLSQLNSVLKGGQQPIMPILDPSLYYTALCSPNLLSVNQAQGNAGMSSEQMQFYKEFMKMRYPPWMGQDGTNAMTVNHTNGSIRKDK